MMAKKENISGVVEEYLCHSCGACFAVCRADAIQFNETVGGYLFPTLDSTACTECGLCYKVCPGVHFGQTLSERVPSDPFVGKIDSCFVGRASEQGVYVNSQSGGVATALLQNLFNTGKIGTAIVAVMREGVPPRGDVLIVHAAEELERCQKSKYTPIPMLKAFRKIEDLSGGVAFVGLSCHMHGLQNLIDVSPELRKKKIYRIGLICDRVMTISAIDFLCRKATEKPAVNLSFRDKASPAYPGNPVVYSQGGTKVILRSSLRMRMKDFFTPVRCRLCFDKLNVFSDVVCGDPHGMSGIDRRNGESLVLVRTETGRVILSAALQHGTVDLRETPVEKAVSGQGIALKRKAWSGYANAWAGMGKKLPGYPFDLLTGNNKSSHRKKLLQGLRLDDYPSRANLFRATEFWLLKRRISAIVLIPFGLIKRPK